MSHIFISYVRENEAVVERLSSELRAAGANVWLDRYSITPGQRWQDSIRQAIQSGAFFLACFSEEYLAKQRSYMSEELVLAIDELRLRPTDRGWFIPVRLADCSIPDRPIGGGETLRAIQWVDLFSDWSRGIGQIKAAVRTALRSTLLQSPWLGIQFSQSGQECTLLQTDDESVQVLLKPEPFVIRMPTVTREGWALICASYDSSIFQQVAHDMQRNDVPFFAGGTGMADTAFGKGNLWIEPEGHMHLDWGERLTPHPDGGGVVLVNVVHKLNVEPPSMPRNRNVYTVIFIGQKDEPVMKNWNFERFILAFS